MCLYIVTNSTVTSVTGTVLPLLSVLGVTPDRVELEETNVAQVMILTKATMYKDSSVSDSHRKKTVAPIYIVSLNIWKYIWLV